MTIQIRPELERMITVVIESGAYENAEEVIERALEFLRSEIDGFDGGAVSDKIERALAQFEQGEFYTAEESLADMRRRKDEWLAARRFDQDPS